MILSLGLVGPIASMRSHIKRRWSSTVIREIRAAYSILIVCHQQLLQISNCQSNLHAVDHANTRFSKNCLANGVGNVVCARHTFVGKTSAADLKKGEK